MNDSRNAVLNGATEIRFSGCLRATQEDRIRLAAYFRSEQQQAAARVHQRHDMDPVLRHHLRNEWPGEGKDGTE